MEPRPSIVVRTASPTRRWVTGGALLLLLGLAMYFIYELGRFDAGYDRLAFGQQRTELEVRIEGLQKENRALRTQLAELDTIRIGSAREQASVRRVIGELEAKIAQQTRELEFYRGIVAQGATAVGVKVEQIQITPDSRTGHFKVHISLVRSVRPERAESGSLALSLDGKGADGKPVTLDHAALTGGKHELPYNFRYLQSLTQGLALPKGFRPEHLSIEVRSGRRDVAPASQTFPWSVEEPVS